MLRTPRVTTRLWFLRCLGCFFDLCVRVMWLRSTLTGSRVALDTSASPGGCPGRRHGVRPQRELCGDAVSTLGSVMFTTRSHRIHTFSDTHMSCCERPSASLLVNTDTQRSAPPCKTASHCVHGKTLEMFSFKVRCVCTRMFRLFRLLLPQFQTLIGGLSSRHPRDVGAVLT